MRIKFLRGVVAIFAITASSVSAFASITNPELPSVRAAQKLQEPIVPTLKAHINLTTQRMTVSAEGRALHTWKISSGRRGYETPTGNFQPTWMSRRWYSRQYRGAPMPYSVFFNRGIATHGTSAVGRLGRPASHGCIRLRTSNARTFYKLVQKHGKDYTEIIVTGRAKQRRYRVAKRRRAVTYAARKKYQKKYRKKPVYQRRHFRTAFSAR